MAKKTRKILTLCLVLVFCISLIAPIATANPWDFSNQYEWYQVYVQGNLVASGQGNGGDMYYLGTHYSADITADGPFVSWYITTHGGYGNAWNDTVDLRNYITVPEGYTVKDYEITSSSVEGVNSAYGSAYFDNAVISITIETLYNDKTQEEIVVKNEKPVIVNHTYSTYDVYTGLTTEDGTETGNELAVVGESYSATPITSYGGNEYEMTGASPDLTITVQEDGNVINIEYLRTIDTTPVPVETEVTVNHSYYTYDIYTGDTVLDGATSGSEATTEGQSYTAVPVTTYGGNAYEVNSVSPALTITAAADASANVIDISYLRTIDTTPVNYSPVLSVEKTADKASYKAGETITWSIVVTNVSEYTAYNISVIDELTGDSWSIDSLAPGASRSFTATTEGAAAGSIQNVAVATWEDGDEIPDAEEPNEIKSTSDDEIALVADPEPENYIPVLDVVKTAAKESYKEGDTVSWDITVKNVSQFTAYDIVIVDELAGDSWTIASLAPGAEKSFTAKMENVEAGTLKNIVVVSWDDGDKIPDEKEPNEVKTTSDEEIITVEEVVPPTTVPPTTEPPTTVPPTTVPPTTVPPTTVPPTTVPPTTVPPTTVPPATEPPVTEPAATVPPVIEEPEYPVAPAAELDDDLPVYEEDLLEEEEIEILDEDVPLADVPETGDVSILWAAMSVLSGGGIVAINSKKTKKEENE